MRVQFFAMAAAMAFGAATPALADYAHIGSVDFRYQMPTERNFSRFGGPVESLNFVAAHGNVFCESIAISYADGRVDTVTSYRLLEDGRGFRFNLPGRERVIDHVFFKCRANDRGAFVEIGAEVGPHRDWAGGRYDRRGPRDDDRSDWHNPPDRGPGDWHGGNWTAVERLTFEGGNDIREVPFAWRGRPLDRMALRAVNTTARCNRVIAKYRNGRSATLVRDRKLERGAVVEFDMPRDQHGLDQIYMRCHAFGDGQALIELLGQR